MVHDKVESLGTWSEVMLEDRETSRPSKLHTGLVLLWCEPSALSKQTQLYVCVCVCGCVCVGGWDVKF